MSKRNNNNPIEDEHVREQLSAYIDDVLSETEHERVRAHLEECVACHTDYTELRATQLILQQMPMAVAPRAFTLTEEMAARVRKPSLLQRIFTQRLAPTFATGSVVAFVALFLLLAGNLLSASNPDAMRFAAPKAGVAQPTTGESQGQTSDTAHLAESTPTAAQQVTLAPNVGGGGELAGPSAAPPSVDAGVAPEPTTSPLSAQRNAVPAAKATGLPSEAQSQVATNTQIESGGTSSPTTVTLDQTSGTNAYRWSSQSPSGDSSGAVSPGSQDLRSVGQAETKLDLMPILLLGLLTLGILLGVAALIARRQNP
jgi:Putative zinc-finger